MTLFAFRDHPDVRFVMVRGLDFVHSNFDMLSSRADVEFGPYYPLEAAEGASLGLKSLSTDIDIAVTFEQPQFSIPPEDMFAHEWTDHERMREYADLLPFELRRSMSVFDISQQVRSLTEHGRSKFPESDTDPLEYLRFAQEGKSLTCRYFAILMGATARVNGYTTRLISLTKHGRAREHAVCEIFVPEFSKWIVVDADFNVAYRQDGEWLNAGELHDAWQQLKNSLKKSGAALEDFDDPAEEVQNRVGVEVVELGRAGSELRRRNMYGGSLTGMNLELYEFVLLSIRNDYLSAEYPLGHPIRTREYVLQTSANTSPPPVAPEAYIIDDINDFYWPVGRSRIDIVSGPESSPPTIGLRFSTWTPNFDRFEVRIDGREWRTASGDRFKLELRPGQNVLELRSRNRSGLAGEISRLTVRLNLKKTGFKEL